MPPNMIGTYLQTHLQDPERGDFFVENEINTKVFRLHDLKPDEEQEACHVIHEAAYILNRHLPRPDRLGPLYRKYYKVKSSDTTYAFGVLAENRKEVEETQGWSVQMALQLNKKVFVCDDKTRQWYKGERFEARLPDSEFKTWVNHFVPCRPPSLDHKSNISLPVSFETPTSNQLEQLLTRRC